METKRIRLLLGLHVLTLGLASGAFGGDRGTPLAAGESVTGGEWASLREALAASPLTVVPGQQAYLKASNADANDTFGQVLAVDGDTAVIGAALEDSAATGVDGDQDDDSAPQSGAAYVFVRNGSTWSQQAYLKASNTGVDDYFGSSVALSGDTLVVGAPFEDSSATGVDGDQSANSALSSGAAYVFVRSGSSWSQQAYLKASNTQREDLFGHSVAIWGDTVVVASPAEDSSASGVNGNQANEAAPFSGAAYVFVRDGSTWSQQAYLKASNTGGADNFGSSVTIAADTLVVGAPTEDSNATGVNGEQTNNAATESGAAYVFVRSGSAWSQEAYLKASNTGVFDSFGHAVAVCGATVLIGARGEASNATGVDGDQASNAAPASGAAYVFVRGASGWSQEAYLKASNTGALDDFGRAVALSVDTALVGASGEDSNALGPGGDELNDAALDSGAAYLFVRRNGGWEQASYIKASNTGAFDKFGWSAALTRDLALVGAPQESSNASGVNGDQANDQAPSAGAAYALHLPRATVLFRNAGLNPASYTASPAVLGGTFTATVDNNLAGKASSLLFAFDTPTSIALGGGQTLLCLDFGSGELFTGGNLFPTSSAGGVDGYALAVPNLPQLDGAVAYTQALQFGGPPFVLSNAQDLTLGAF